MTVALTGISVGLFVIWLTLLEIRDELRKMNERQAASSKDS